MLLSTAYFPPLAWLALAARDMIIPCHSERDTCHSERSEESPDDRIIPSHVFLEACESYQKQSYRNRCYILAGDGPQMLQVPVVHPVRANAPERVSPAPNIRNILVDYSTPWVVRTQRALDTAYETAAYYDYYRDELFALLDARPRTLWELNLSTILFLIKHIGIACELEPTRDFAAPGSVPDDYRTLIHPKRPDTVLKDLGLDRPYYQVFRDRLGGFTPRLSALDLLFNEGPDSLAWVKKG